MSRLGTGGSVRSWIRARVAEKGEERPLKACPSGDCALSRGGGAGPEAGPRTGPLGGSFAGITGAGGSAGFVFGTDGVSVEKLV